MSDTGPTLPTRVLVVERAGGYCELCALPATTPVYRGQIHHRRPRGIGGSSDPAINQPSNLALLCGDCHRFVETIARESAYRYGWLVPMGESPREWPFLLYGQWVELDDRGGYVPRGDLDERGDELEPF